MKELIQIHKNDNVIIALTDLKKGFKFSINNIEIALIEDISKGHKISITDMPIGSNIIKYGMTIGHLLKDIKKGQWIHNHNLKTNLKDLTN